ASSRTASDCWPLALGTPNRWPVFCSRQAKASPDRGNRSPDPKPGTKGLAIFANYDILGGRVSVAKEDSVPTRNINLTEHYDKFVEEQIDAGKYKNASEVLRAGLRLLEEQTRTDEQKLKLLRKLAADGFRELDQGQGVNVSSESELRNAIGKIGRRAAKAVRQRKTE
ncbi:MAG: type II toxin-antitoxin system ParD family antitoxin, partial [Bdellovibrionales bacterium]|nr:type II toxin-antitoxin system ParD family antitoxin [Bdellovibrionales bacterium]